MKNLKLPAGSRWQWWPPEEGSNNNRYYFYMIKILQLKLKKTKWMEVILDTRKVKLALECNGTQKVKNFATIKELQAIFDEFHNCRDCQGFQWFNSFGINTCHYVARTNNIWQSKQYYTY